MERAHGNVRRGPACRLQAASAASGPLPTFSALARNRSHGLPSPALHQPYAPELSLIVWLVAVGDVHGAQRALCDHAGLLQQQPHHAAFGTGMDEGGAGGGVARVLVAFFAQGA
jgi:hypothetical protein